ncbi:hypothetical protein KFE25_014047 [Diacronema lutheri]|uniref:Uncharacterized protein n=1 Tax=Diacronema lutheri TaxID=2081491 RepID=A0A8J5XDX2_DIALT|nr:hypothetical protein KFE25_014047 [Diacronema lutheri]
MEGAESALAERLHDLRAALRADDEDSVLELLLALAHAVRALDPASSSAALRTCARLQLLPLLRAASERYGVESYAAKLALCICANVAEAGGAATVREGGGLALLGGAISSRDVEIRYLAVAALRNQLAFDAPSHAAVLGTKVEAQLMMLLSSAIDVRTLDSATSALNNLYGLHGDRALALGAPPPLPHACADSLARRCERLHLDELAFGYADAAGAPAAADADAARQRALARSLVPGLVATGGGVHAGKAKRRPSLDAHAHAHAQQHGGFAELAAALGRALGAGRAAGGVGGALGGTAAGAGSASEAKMQLLLKANFRRRIVVSAWAALTIQAAARARAARRACARRARARAADAARARAATTLQARARAKLAAARARDARDARRRGEAASRARLACACGIARRWLLRLRGRQLVRASRHVRELIRSAPVVRGTHTAQLSRLREMRGARKLDEGEWERLSSSVSAAHAAFEMELPRAMQRVEILRRWLAGAGPSPAL